ncbi:MAG: S8 family serine peptidase [Patescibacteria group bacterium]|jgi:subtilisin family serine protease|nr:S8 family serine peptidase [Patescibacteria group bacterium]
MKKKLTSIFVASLIFLVLLPFGFVGAINLENNTFKSAIIPTDSYFNNAWYLNKIKAVDAWNIIRETPDITIAIIDSGVQISHPDLRDNIWINRNEIAGDNIDNDNNGYVDDLNGWDFVDHIPDPSPKFDADFTEDGVVHGTVVAGIAAASGNNAAGVVGVTWNAKIMPLRVLNGSGEGDTNKVVNAVDYAIRNGADIINFSFVGFGFSSQLNSAIKRAYDAGIIIVAAAGNEGEDGLGHSLDDKKMYPVCNDGNSENWVIGVAATDPLDQKSNFSSFGYDCIDISAPGVSMFSTSVYSPDNSTNSVSFDKYYDGYWSGTSMAAPIVSGVVALIKQVNPNLSRDEVVGILLDTSDNINKLNPEYFGKMGVGRVNAYKAVSKAKEIFVDYEASIVVSPASNKSSNIKIVDQKGNLKSEFLAYTENFKGGANIATGDIDGDGYEEIVVGAGNGGGPHVVVFDTNGKLKYQFFAYNSGFRGGVNVAVADVNDDGVDDIITGAGVGGGPHVRIFNKNGDVLGQFFAYNDNFRGGVNVSAGDIDGDGEVEIVTGTGTGGGPQVRIFKSDGRVVGQFFAYDENFRGGVKVHVGDIDGGSSRNKKEIITSPGPGGGPHVRIFNNFGAVLNQFFVFDKKFRGGVNIALGDVNKDNKMEIIAGAGPGGTPHLRVYSTSGVLLSSFYAYENTYSGGLNVSVIKLINPSTN